MVLDLYSVLGLVDVASARDLPRSTARGSSSAPGTAVAAFLDLHATVRDSIRGMSSMVSFYLAMFLSTGGLARATTLACSNLPRKPGVCTE